DFEAGLAFLMDWPALAEAQAMLVARAAEVDGASPRLADWASRLEARHPLGALILTRAMIRAGAPAKPSRLLQAELADAQALAARAPDLKGVAAHEDFVRDLDRGGPRR
ncbi:MAG TPA: hypothetical protein VGB49_08880, partial [Caulobacteraceae bacterium]